jgi:hypothetical protein
MEDKIEPYRLYDNKVGAFVNQKDYASQSSASRVADRKNLEYGAHRYSAEKYSDIVRRYTPKNESVTNSIRGGSGRSANIDMGGGIRPGQSPSLENPIRQAKGGKVSSFASKRADGIAQRGKTKGRIF